MLEHRETDYLVIGSGLAGLYFALHASEHGKVTIITKKAPTDANTNYAQGGIAAVLGAEDSFDAHIDDTLRVGEGLCKRRIVELCVHEAPGHIRHLAELGAAFGRTTEGSFELGREGGHSQRRIVHAKDLTGREVERALLAAVHARRDRIEILDNHMAVDLLSTAKYGGPNACFGAFVLDRKSNEVGAIVARATVLASGGSGKVYLYTTNPDVATGDGVALAYRIGAQIGNMEFVQFHPTALYHPLQTSSFLISEALRGEGGVLRLRDGSTFMERYHEMKSLAPRDVVARAIDNELKRTGDDSVMLDMTHLPGDFLVERFPNIHEHCMKLGIDMRKQPIPVVPAAHYQCGGVVTDERAQTTVKNLLACGEVAHTGLHGACRLASNSLLEALVFARRAADAVKDLPKVAPPAFGAWSKDAATDSDDAIVVTSNWDEIRRTMWSYVGIVRTDKRLERARRRIELIREEIREYYWNFLITPDLLELRNISIVAQLVVESARRRKESRGLHYNLDYHYKDERYLKDTVLVRGNGPTI